MESKLQQFLEMQMQQMKIMNEQMQNMQASFIVQSTQVNNSNVPWPKPLQIEGDVKENFELFKSNWDTYLKATGMDTWTVDKEEQKVNILLSIIGDTAKMKYNNFELTDEDKENSSTVLKKISEKLVPERNYMYERWRFHNCIQLAGENFDTYLVRLNKIVSNCYFDKIEKHDFKKTLLRDRIVFGINDNDLKKKFLKDNPDKLTLEGVINACRINEVTEDRFKHLNNDKAINKIVNKEVKNKSLIKCKFCSKKHVFEKDLCPALKHQCKICFKKGHYESCCFKKTKENKKKPRKVHEINEERDNEDNDMVIAKISNNSITVSTLRTGLRLKFGKLWKNVECDLDTGADVCLMGHKFLCKMLNNRKPKLQISHCKLKSFGGNSIEVLGEMKLLCEHKEKTYSILFQIVNIDHGPLLSANACTTLGLLKFCKNVRDISKNTGVDDFHVEAEQIIQDFEDVFAGKGLLPGTVELEIDDNVKPVIQTARRIPINMRERLKQELEQLVKEGIIIKEEQHTDWVSNILLVQKNNSFRICLDPIPLNKALKRPNYQFPTIDEAITELSKAKVFTTVDATKGFWQLKLTDASSKLTCFWTPFGRYRWLRLPFGISPAPELFTMKILELVQDLPGIEVMADDILIYGTGDTMEEAIADHNVKLKKLLERCRQSNCKLNKAKLKLCQTSVKFYGHILSDEGMKADTSKITAIRDMPIPKNKTDLKRFLGMINYLGRYIKNLSIESVTLRNLLLENVDWKWTEKEDNEFNKLKDIVCDIKALKYYNPKESIIMECDSSSEGLGVVLYQEEKVVAYASRTLTRSERNYAMIEKELLSILFGCIRFDQMIVGNQNVTIRTDHKPLLSIFQKPLLKAPKRLQLMLMSLQRYPITLEYIKGKENIVADTLSRAAIDADENNETNIKKSHVYFISREQETLDGINKVKLIRSIRMTDERIENIKEETRKDTALQKLMFYIANGWPRYIKDVPDDIKIYFKYKHELSVQDGLVFRNEKILIPYNLRKTMVQKVHVTHLGIENTLKLAKDNIFWPGMSSQITENVRNCDICQKYARSQQKLPMMSHQIPDYPGQMISLDICFAKYQNKQQKILVIIDHYSDYFEAEFLENITTKSIIQAMKQFFSRFGVAEIVCSDNGTNFVNHEMMEFSRRYNFKHITSAPYHQQGNGKAEATVKIVKKLLTKCEEDNEDFYWALLHLRNTPNKMNSSPIQRMISRRTRTGIPITACRLQPEIIQNVSEDIEVNKRNSKYYYDKKTKDLPELQIGEQVSVQLRPDLDKQWSRGTITEKTTDRSYKVSVNGKEVRRDRINLKEAHERTNQEDMARNQMNNSEPAQEEEQHPDRGEERKENPGQSEERKECPGRRGESPDRREERTEGPGRREERKLIFEKEDKPYRLKEEKMEVKERPKRTIVKPSKYKDFVL